MKNPDDMLFRILFTRNFTNREILDMDINKNNVRLGLDEDELSRLTTTIYHESGYSLDRDDPLIVQYLIHKIALAQFTENQGKVMIAFADSLLPYIRETEERFEQRKTEFVDHIANVHRESLQAMNDQYLKMVNGTLDKVGKTVATQMENIIKYMRSEQYGMSKMLEEQRGKFRGTVGHFEKLLWNAACIVGGGFVVSVLVLIVWFYLR